MFDKFRQIVDNGIMAKIVSLERSGCARRAGIKKGDELVMINNKPFNDILDYEFADAEDVATLKINRLDKTIDIECTKRFDGDSMGIEFDDSVCITANSCVNKCVFCFVDQMPKGMRETLYVKDDDYRLSFISGNYITCTNLSPKDIDRILEYKLSPLYISVHATDHKTRCELLGIKKASNQMELLQKFADNNIKIYAQIVLVGGINDGDILCQSLTDLYEIGDNLKGVAVVPVGLTKYRDNLPQLNPLSETEARGAIDIIEKFYAEHPNFCYASDEMYQLANKEVPNFDYYGDFQQIENGVGLIAKFLREIEDALANIPKKLNKSVALITGVGGYATMLKTRELLQEHWRKLKMDIYCIENNFFGKTVTTTGLITAGDIIDQMRDVELTHNILMIPQVMLREFEDVFLDNVSLVELETILKHKIIVSPVDGECFVDTIMYGDVID